MKKQVYFFLLMSIFFADPILGQQNVGEFPGKAISRKDEAQCLAIVAHNGDRELARLS